MSSPTKANTGTTEEAGARTASTSKAAKVARKGEQNTRPESQPEITVDQALLATQDITRFCNAAGIKARVLNVPGGSAVILPGVFFCHGCRTFTQGTACQKCAQPENPEIMPAKEL